MCCSGSAGAGHQRVLPAGSIVAVPLAAAGVAKQAAAAVKVHAQVGAVEEGEGRRQEEKVRCRGKAAAAALAFMLRALRKLLVPAAYYPFPPCCPLTCTTGL